MDEALRQEEWDRLYAALRRIFGAVGTEDPIHGDFWVVDDDWGNASQKVAIANVRVLTPMVVDAIRLELQRLSLPWAVVLHLEPDGYDDLKGITVEADRVEEFWDKARLRSLFGDKFVW